VRRRQPPGDADVSRRECCDASRALPRQTAESAQRCGLPFRWRHLFHRPWNASATGSTGPRQLTSVPRSPDGPLVIATTECEHPNGLAFSPDEHTLYAANMHTRMFIHAFDVHPDGSLSNHRFFASMSSPYNGASHGCYGRCSDRVLEFSAPRSGGVPKYRSS
jgi:SMP-30/Gluconolactonase/LRE-like region